MINVTKTPWPWFGGKSEAAPAVWEALGDPGHYAEPFAGTLAVLLRRPALCNRPYYSETVNDLDGLLVNAWRGIQLYPDATAEAASWPVSEADLMARHLALCTWRAEHNLERLMADPAFCDPVMAGWWIWGCSCWIGGGWCSGTGPWAVGPDGRITKRGRPGVNRKRPHLANNGQGVNTAAVREPGVNCKRPHLANDGQGVNTAAVREPGVNRQRPHIGDDGQGVNTAAVREPGVSRQRPATIGNGVGVNHAGVREPGVADADCAVWTPDDFHPMTMPQVRTWFAFLSARLRHVRILNGDWRRLCTNGALKTLSVRGKDGPDAVAGVFLDPPYADTARRSDGLYAQDSLDVAHDVHEWALAHGEDRKLRIVVAGFDGEDGGAFEAAGWRAVEWFTNGYLSGGMGNIGGGESGSTTQQHRERLWLSPHCLQPAEPTEPAQLSLFDEVLR